MTPEELANIRERIAFAEAKLVEAESDVARLRRAGLIEDAQVLEAVNAKSRKQLMQLKAAYEA